ncbi:MAG: ABC transporter permease subunit [Thermodesulfobacteriota bacterium]
MSPIFALNPISRKRLRRFTEIRRAYFSFLILGFLYLTSLGAELICNNTPLYIRYNGESYFPFLRFYPDDTFTGSGKNTRPDYRQIAGSPEFANNPDNAMLFPLIASGPYESIPPDSIASSDGIIMTLRPMPRVGTANIDPDYTIVSSASFGVFLGQDGEAAKGSRITDGMAPSPELRRAVELRFQNRPAPAFVQESLTRGGMRVRISLPAYAPRSQSPGSVRLTLRQMIPEKTTATLPFSRESLQQGRPEKSGEAFWREFSRTQQEKIVDRVGRRFKGTVDDITLLLGGTVYSAAFVKEDIRFPYGPVKGHLLGIDGAGRDVAARIIYGLRTSMTFGLLLVLCSMALGILAGALQGYYGGGLDITAQRLIEIWSALPFLYVMILMGSVYGRSFTLLLFCYGIFNWIGISYYIRAEFLRLRKQPFVEAAKCMGISSFKIIFRHILPNGITPVITFFPFSLVGAIGSLAALDYLGFGMPPPTPSWGELLYQAQQYRWAWWLILYPSLALFIVMLLGVFVGEGIRNAYDPKRYTRLEG